MGNKSLMPMAKQERPGADLQWDLLPRALERWAPNLQAASQSEADTISIFDEIGFSWTGEGVTAKRIAAALRSIGHDNDVIVNINSPGGDMFEGITIYNLLREHRGRVKVKVLGMAASAASLIAMAGDEIEIASSGFLMIHNTWVVVLGNRNDLRDVASELEPFDEAMAGIYAARTGISVKAIHKKMDDETWINGTTAVEEGWADSLLPADEVQEDKSAKGGKAAALLLDKALAKAGLPRSERRALLQDFKAGTDADELLHPTRAVAGAQTTKEHDMTDVQKPAATQPATPEQLKAEYDRGVAEGKAAGTAEVAAARVAERARIGAITGHAEATGREALAAHFANDTEMTVEQAAKALAAAPKQATGAAPTNMLAAHMAQIPNPTVGADAGHGEETEASVAARIVAAGKGLKLKAVK